MDRAKLLFKAQIAEKADRYDDMAKFMKEVTEQGGLGSPEERNLFGEAYRNKLARLRTSMRIIKQLGDRKKARNKVEAAKVAAEMREKVVKQIKETCNEGIELIEKHVRKAAVDAAGKAFAAKMLGDLHRYLAETGVSESKAAANKAYEEAEDNARHLEETDPLRLSIQLNKAVFMFEIMENHKEAVKIAKSAHEQALLGSKDGHFNQSLMSAMLYENIQQWEQAH